MTTPTPTAQPPRLLPVKWFAVLPVLDAAAAAISLYATLTGGEEASAAAGVSTAYLVVGSLFFIVLGLAAAAAIWLGRPWGWWLAAYYFVYTAVRSLNGLVVTLATGQPSLALSQFGLPLLVAVIVLFYLYAPASLHYFGVTLGQRWRSLLLFVAAGIATVLLFLALAELL